MHLISIRIVLSTKTRSNPLNLEFKCGFFLKNTAAY